MKVYFDNAATTKVRDEAIESMNRVMSTDYGNPSSMHAFGRQANTDLQNARRDIATALGIGRNPERIFFTSGGTEANNWAIFGACEGLKRKGRHIITSVYEHSAVLDPIKKLESQGWEVTYLSPDSTGCIPKEVFSEALREDTVFASIMLVNNETGAINPINEFSEEIKRRDLITVLHTDAIQALCKIPVSVRSLGADLISISSHKLHGPKGVGALYAGAGTKLSSLILGGSQEKSSRGGTEALPAAVGFGMAVRFGITEMDETVAHVQSLRTCLSELLSKEIPEIIFINNEKSSSNHSPFIMPISLPWYNSEVLMNFLDGEDIYVSRSAACKKGARSRSLEAMSLKNDVIDGALRISFSRYSTKEEADYFVKKLKEASVSITKSNNKKQR